MAFPTVESVTETSFASATTAHECDLPATVNAGDLLLLIFANDGNTVQTTPSGWTALDKQTQGNQVYGGVYALDAAGTEGGGTVDVVTASAEAGSGHVYRITGWGGDVATHIDISALAFGTSDLPNPLTVTAGWGSEDNLFLAIACAGDDDESVNTGPINYTNIIDVACGAGANNSGRSYSARRNLAAASDNPGSFDLTGSENWVAWTVVVAPVLGAAIVELFEETWILDPNWEAFLLPQTNDGNIGSTLGQLSMSFSGINVDPEIVEVIIGTAIRNLDATTDVPQNFEICDRTGFKQYPGGLKVEYYGHAVRKKSFEERHPQEVVRHRGMDRQRGSKSPEPEDVFVGTVSAEDL